MNYAFLPDLSALAILIVILALVRRRHSEERANAWLLGLVLTLIEAVAHTFYAPDRMPGRALHIIVLDCYLLAGLVFIWAAGNQRHTRGIRFLYLAVNGLPLLVLDTIYGLNLRVAHAYVPVIAIGIVAGVVSSILLRRSWQYAGLYLAGWVALAVLVANGRFRPAVYLSLGAVYAIAALNFYRRLERRSTGKLAIVTGFAIWSLCFLIHPWICLLYTSIIVDAKTPMDAFLMAIRTSDVDERNRQLRRHAGQVRAHLDVLETKAYWKQFTESPDFVICFLPKEALFSAALESDPSLIDYGTGKVILSTPTTLIALLKAIAYGWQQVEMARDAQIIKETAIGLYDKVASLYDSFSAIGERLRSTAKAWEKTRVQMEGRGGVFALGRRLRKYGIGGTDLKETSELLLEMHSLQAEDWKPDEPVSIAASGDVALLASEDAE